MVRRVERTTLGVAGFCILFLLQFGDWGLVGSFTIGVAVGLAVLRSQTAVVGLLFSLRRDHKRRPWHLALYPAKYLIIGAVLYGLLAVRWFQPPSFVGGFVVVQAVLLLKAVGRLLCEGLQRAEERDKLLATAVRYAPPPRQ